MWTTESKLAEHSGNVDLLNPTTYCQVNCRNLLSNRLAEPHKLLNPTRLKQMAQLPWAPSGERPSGLGVTRRLNSSAI